MILFIILAIAAIIGIRYGIRNRNKVIAAASIAVLSAIVMIVVVYLYFYAKNPY